MADKTVHKTLNAPVIKSEELPDDLRKAAEGEEIDRWFWASVEVPDHEKDIIRIAGIDTKKYAQNGGTIKFISNHSRAASHDGRLPVIGKTVKWVATKHTATGMPAMAAAVKFAPTDLGEEMKKLYDGGFLTDVSIGAEAIKGKPLESGGIDYEHVAIAELSACINGMNQFAGVLRALEVEEPKPEVKPEPLTLSDADLLRFVEPMNKRFDLIAETFAALEKKFASRFDDVEDSISSLPKGAAPQDERKEQPSTKIDRDKLIAALRNL